MQTVANKRVGKTILQFLLLTLCVMLGAKALQAQSQRELFRRVMPSVVLVHAEKKISSPAGQANGLTEASKGSGALLAADGKVVTSAAIVRSAFRVEVEFFDGSRVAARVLTASAQADVALLQVDKVPEKAVVAKWGDSSTTAVGDEVFMIGSAAGSAQGLAVSWVSARLSTEKTAAAETSLELLQLDAAALSGNSGCPVFNLKGEVIGMVSHALAKSTNGTKAGVAITSKLVRTLLLEDKVER